jgi:hypothetical protein
MSEIIKVRKICWVEPGEWRNAEGKGESISPTVGDLVDILCSNSDWKMALQRRNLSFAFILGNEDYVTVVNLKYESKQSKIVIRGFKPRPKTIRRS